MLTRTRTELQALILIFPGCRNLSNVIPACCEPIRRTAESIYELLPNGFRISALHFPE